MDGINADDKNLRITENDLPQEFILKLLGQSEAKGLWGIKHTREPVDTMVKYAKNHELSLPLVQVVITKEGVFMSPIKCKLNNQLRENILIKKMENRHYSDRRFVNSYIIPTETWNSEKLDKPDSLSKRIRESSVEFASDKTDNSNKETFNCFLSKKVEEKKAVGKPTDLQLLEKYSKFDWRSKGIFFFGIDTISYGVQDLIYTRVFSMIVVLDKKKRSSGCGNSPFMCHAFVCESRCTAKKVTYALAAAFQAYGRSMKFLRVPQKPLKSYPEAKPKKITIELRPAMEVAFNDSEA